MAVDLPVLPESVPPGVWRFGTCVLDERVATLRVNGTSVELDRGSHDVLLALLRQAGSVVTKDELLDAGWPGRVVSENSLSKAVGRLRTALGGDGHALRAVHGYGYRLAIEAHCDRDLPPLPPLPPSRALREGDALPQRPGWRLHRSLGDSSAGPLFLARSAEGAQRTVKLATGAAGLRSLRREIALWRHLQAAHGEVPALAPVLGWNLREAPFFLELPHYPEGHLQDWAAARGGLGAVPLAQRLGVGVQLCRAVADLHALGLIHAGLRPEAIHLLPGESGWQLVLSDLGVAEAARAGMPDATSSPGPMDTPGVAPHYRAPEVAAGHSPTQGSDVFALGLLVYQLATGNLLGSLAPGWETTVVDPLLREDIAAAAALDPRARIDARSLALRLEQLDVRRARRHAEAERERRDVEHAEQLAASRARRRLSLAVTTTLAVGLVATSGMYLAAERQRATAEATAVQRDAMLAFLTRDLLGQADPYHANAAGPRLALGDAIDNAAARVGSSLGGDPAAAAAVHQMLGTIYFGQDEHAKAIAQLRRARALYLPLGQAHATSLVQVETALCDVHRIGDHLADAEEACLAAAARARAAGVGEALATLKLGQLRGEQGRYLESRALLQPLLREATFAADPIATGELHWALGLAARALGEYAQARDHFNVLLDVARKGDKADSWSAWAYNSLGSVLVELGEYDRAEAMLLASRDAFIRAQGANQVEVQMPQAWRADIRLRRGQWQEARSLLEGMQSAWGGKLKPGHALRLRAEAGLAWAEAMSGARVSARSRLAAALRDRAVQFDRPDDRTAATRTLRWIRTALALQDQASATVLLELFERRLRPLLPPTHPLAAEADCLHARWAVNAGQDAVAHGRAVACRDGLRATLPATHPLHAEPHALLAALPGDRAGGTGRVASAP